MARFKKGLCNRKTKTTLTFQCAFCLSSTQFNSNFTFGRNSSSILKMELNSSGVDDDKYVIFKQDDLFAESFPLMKEIRRQGKLCDVTLKVEEQSFSAHRIVLAATIPYFYAMFTHNLVESRIKEIEMKEIEPQAIGLHIVKTTSYNNQIVQSLKYIDPKYILDPRSGEEILGIANLLPFPLPPTALDEWNCIRAALESLINFAYSGVVKIDNQNVQGLMVGASFLQLNKVRDACADFLISRFHSHNVLGIRQFADSLGCLHLVSAAEKYIHQYFSKVAQSDEFSALGFDELIDIIRRDELNVPTEENIFEACMKWIKYDESRSSMLPQVLAKVRLPLLTPQFLADRVATEDLIRTSHQCRDLLDEAKDFHLMPERRGLVQSYRTRPRCGDYVIGQIYAVGGLTKNGESVSTVEIYDPVTKEWRMGEAMSMLRSRVGVATLNGKLYAFGGFNGSERLSTVEVYDPKTKSWYQGKAMLCKRSAVGVASLDDYVYVCGGYDGVTSLSTVECYCPKTDSWATVAPMMKYRSAGGVSALGGYVYALGGHDGLSIFDSVERYDPLTNSWTKVVPMLNRRCRLGVATLNGKLYACGGYDGNQFLRSVEMYDPNKDAWKLVAPMNVKRSRVALSANMGKLWAIGGYDGESNLSTVEVYDPETDAWTFVASMCAHGGGVGAGVIPIT